jgi:mRNA interferase MazF
MERRLVSIYIPERSDVIMLDFDPTKGKEIGKYRPALVLSSKLYNQKTGLLICCPISTSIRGSVTEVALSGLVKPSVVAASMIYTFDWRERRAKWLHTANDETMVNVLKTILPLMGAHSYFHLTELL